MGLRLVRTGAHGSQDCRNALVKQVGSEMARLDDVRVGRPLADVDVDASGEALSRLQTMLLTVVAPMPSPGGD